ncbi:hypothetical protein SAMD00079811_18780 [Scytonema sp. HK-05]|nr:hypothetical protein SAMD00079811_18780 [Scytonema sp. HK-05]
MHPPIAHFETFFAALGAGCNVVDLIEMRTVCAHRIILMSALIVTFKATQHPSKIEQNSYPSPPERRKAGWGRIAGQLRGFNAPLIDNLRISSRRTSDWVLSVIRQNSCRCSNSLSDIRVVTCFIAVNLLKRSVRNAHLRLRRMCVVHIRAAPSP